MMMMMMMMMMTRWAFWRKQDLWGHHQYCPGCRWAQEWRFSLQHWSHRKRTKRLKGVRAKGFTVSKPVGTKKTLKSNCLHWVTHFFGVNNFAFDFRIEDWPEIKGNQKYPTSQPRPLDLIFRGLKLQKVMDCTFDMRNTTKESEKKSRHSPHTSQNKKTSQEPLSGNTMARPSSDWTLGRFRPAPHRRDQRIRSNKYVQPWRKPQFAHFRAVIGHTTATQGLPINSLLSGRSYGQGYQLPIKPDSPEYPAAFRRTELVYRLGESWPAE